MSDRKRNKKGIRDPRLYGSFLIHSALIILISQFTVIKLLMNYTFLVNFNLLIFGFTLTTLTIIFSIRKRTLEKLSINKSGDILIEYKFRLLTILGTIFLGVLLSGFSDYDSYIYIFLSTITLATPFSILTIFVIDLFDHLYVENKIDSMTKK